MSGDDEITVQGDITAEITDQLLKMIPNLDAKHVKITIKKDKAAKAAAAAAAEDDDEGDD